MAALTAAKADQVGGELEVGAYTPYFPSTVPPSLRRHQISHWC